MEENNYSLSLDLGDFSFSIENIRLECYGERTIMDFDCCFDFIIKTNDGLTTIMQKFKEDIAYIHFNNNCANDIIINNGIDKVSFEKDEYGYYTFVFKTDFEWKRKFMYNKEKIDDFFIELEAIFDILLENEGVKNYKRKWIYNSKK